MSTINLAFRDVVQMVGLWHGEGLDTWAKTLQYNPPPPKTNIKYLSLWLPNEVNEPTDEGRAPTAIGNHLGIYKPIFYLLHKEGGRGKM